MNDGDPGMVRPRRERDADRVGQLPPGARRGSRGGARSAASRCAGSASPASVRRRLASSSSAKPKKSGPARNAAARRRAGIGDRIHDRIEEAAHQPQAHGSSQIASRPSGGGTRASSGCGTLGAETPARRSQPCASKAAASISPVGAILAAPQPAAAGTRSQTSRSRAARRSGSARCGGSKWWRPSKTSRV